MRIVTKKRVSRGQPERTGRRNVNNVTYERKKQEEEHISAEEYRALEKKLIDFVQSKGYKLIPMIGDGNCLFRAIAHQIYGDQEMHDQIRKLALDYMVTERDHFSQYVTEEFEDYIERKRQNGCYGNSLELQAVSEMFNRPVEVYSNGAEPLNIFNSEFPSDAPIRVSYHNGNHYNAVIDPEHPTIGVGLGLPDLNPGEADRTQVEKAVELSEQELIEKAKTDSERELLEKALAESMTTSDKEINLSIEDAVIQQSRNEYWQQILQNSTNNNPK